MALGDKEDVHCAVHGSSHEVVLYCFTCHIPICVRCVACSTSPDCESTHKEHTFLEINEACGIFKVSYFVI